MSLTPLPESLQQTAPIQPHPRSPRRYAHAQSAPYTPRSNYYSPTRSGRRIENFIRDGISEAKSDADRLFVYQQAKS